MHEGELLGQMEDVFGQRDVGGLFAIDGIVNGLDAIEAATLLDGIDQAEILQSDGLGEDVEIGDGELGEGQLVGVLAVFLNETLHVAEVLETEGLEDGQELHHRSREDLCLIDGGNPLVQTVEGTQLKELPEGVG